MKLRFSKQARDDLDKAYAYTFERDPKAADRIEERVLSGARRLEQLPRAGRPGRVPGTRELVIPRTRYTLIYELGDEEITLLRILHQARQWPPGG